ncbi:MAG: sterol desaturase family protein [Cellulophaga sp.]|uniref:sterol desaturase family protein n=1 Tax=Cellulophaga sp. TaxID=1972202 RepID=UPI003263F153
MISYTTALLYAIPFFMLLMAIEIAYGYFIKKQMYTVLDTVSSISSGFTNIIKDSLGIGLLIVSYPFLVKHLALFNIGNSWGVWLIGFLFIDFAGYWNHRLSHKINIFWNQHVIHHSSEEFNLSCALRQSISNLIGYVPLLLLPVAILGVPEQVIAVLAPLHLFAQFWYHTRHIGKLGWLEYVIVTPSQHRVHHAINSEYIDKNLGQIFSFWDRLFGTFQEELDEVPPQYGVLKPAATWNPVHINFQHFLRLAKDAWHTKNVWDKIRIWFMPTGWRPNDVKQKYPIDIIEDVYTFDRYATEASKLFKGYVIFQMFATLGLMLFLFYNFESIGFTAALLYGSFIFVGIYGYTTLMDRKKYALTIEVIRSMLGVAYLIIQNGWFGMQVYFKGATSVMLSYFLITIAATIYFTLLEKEFFNKEVVV